MSIPNVSVLVPIYNAERFLPQCLDNVVNQTLKDIEIILINDGSTDGSLEIMKSYAGRDPRVRIIDKKNTGYGNSLNMGIAEARGEYVGIIESDDFPELNMFEVLYSEAKEHDLDVSRCNFYLYNTEKGSRIKADMSSVPQGRVYPPSENISVFYQQPSVWANIYRTSFLRDNGILFLETPGASYQDTAFSFKVYALAERFKMVKDVLHNYRIDNEASSSVQQTSKVYCVCDEYGEIRRFIRERGLYQKYRYMVARLMYNGYSWNHRRLAAPHNEEFMVAWRNEFHEEMRRGNIKRDVFGGEYARAMKIANEGEMVNRPKVSVVIPVYNMEKFLDKCLDSIVNQTLDEIEIICVNDGSTDGSRDILSEYETRDPRVYVIEKANGGLSSARNAGMRLASAEYIGFVDSDDWVEPETFGNAYANILGADIVSFGTNVVGDAMMERRASDEEYYSVKHEGMLQLDDKIRLDMDVATWNKLYRVDLIRDNNLSFPEGKLYEDYPFFWKYVFLCDTAHFDPCRYYNYLRRKGSIMDKTFKGHPKAIHHLEHAEEIHGFLTQSGIYEKHEKTFESIFDNCFWFAYQNVPSNQRKRVVRLAEKYVSRMGLTEGSAVDKIKTSKSDGFKKAPLLPRLFKKGISLLEKISGRNMSHVSEFLGGYSVWDLADASRSHVSAGWVSGHEDFFKMERWHTIYDYASPDKRFNWGRRGGIEDFASIDSSYLSGALRAYHVYISLVEIDGRLFFLKGISDEDGVRMSATGEAGGGIFHAVLCIDGNDGRLVFRIEGIREEPFTPESVKVLRMYKSVSNVFFD